MSTHPHRRELLLVCSCGRGRRQRGNELAAIFFSFSKPKRSLGSSNRVLGSQPVLESTSSAVPRERSGMVHRRGLALGVACAMTTCAACHRARLLAGIGGGVLRAGLTRILALRDFRGFEKGLAGGGWQLTNP